MTINEYSEECKKLTYNEFKFYSEDTLEWIDEALISADKQTRKDLNNTSRFIKCALFFVCNNGRIPMGCTDEYELAHLKIILDSINKNQGITPRE